MIRFRVDFNHWAVFWWVRQLHRDPEVTFAGYKIPHPLEYRMLIKVWEIHL